MERIILIKYGELSTKKGNRNFFISTLYNNLKNRLNDYDVNIYKDRARMYVEFNEDEFNDIKDIIDKTFGIHSYHIAYVVDSNDSDIQKLLLEVIEKEKFSTFKVDVRRADKNFPISSQDYNRVLGGLILKNISNISVDVHNPDILITVEIREKKTFIYFNNYKGSGGYPVGVQKKGLLMLSGGIDSPVSGYLAMKRGVCLDAVYFEAMPHTSIGAREKVINLCRKLANYTDKINLHIVNFTPIQEEIYKTCRKDYIITIMRRMMYRISERLANYYNAYVVVNGESIGQVASQTLTSMACINSVTNIPVIRPVACLDKLEIMEIARKIDTYDISIIPYEDCCTVFVPPHPIINPKIEVCVNEENKFDYEAYIAKAVESVNTIQVTNKRNEEFNEFL